LVRQHPCKAVLCRFESDPGLSNFKAPSDEGAFFFTAISLTESNHIDKKIVH
jgi:hypothetical protein